MRLDEEVWSNKLRVMDNDNLFLLQQFTEDDVLKVIKDLPSNSTSGPDGFPTFFYKEFWGVIKKPFIELMKDFSKGVLDIKRLNYGVVTLIPKLKEVSSIRQFRPICLLNVSFKILTKLLATRLGVIADRIVNKSQSAFIKGRNILDGVVALHEIVHELRCSKRKGVILKLNFEKAYDKIHWNFLEEVMLRKGFSNVGLKWL